MRSSLNEDPQAAAREQLWKELIQRRMMKSAAPRVTSAEAKLAPIWRDTRRRQKWPPILNFCARLFGG